MRLRMFGALLLLSAITGCAHAPAAPCLAPVSGLRYCLLPPDALPADSAPRLVHVSGPDIDRHMLSRLVIGDDELVMDATTLLGQPLFRIHYAGNAREGFELLHSPADARIRADWLIALLQFAGADSAAVNAALQGAHLESGDGERRLLRNDVALMVINVSGDLTEIRIPEQSTTLRIRRLDSGAGTP